MPSSGLSPPDRCRGVVSSATISTPLTHSEWAVCVIFILSSIFYKGQQGAPIIFPVQSWHEAALRQGRVSLITRKNQKKMFVPLHFFQAREGRVFKIQENLCGVLSQIARRLRCSDKRRHANIRRRSEAQHCSSLCSQSEGDEYCGGQTRLKIQRRYALKRWLCSLRVRGPHFASKVSYNVGAEKFVTKFRRQVANLMWGIAP